MVESYEADGGGVFFNAAEPVHLQRALSMTRGSIDGTSLIALYVGDDDNPIFLPEELVRRVLGSEPKAEQN